MAGFQTRHSPQRGLGYPSPALLGGRIVRTLWSGSSWIPSIPLSCCLPARPPRYFAVWDHSGHLLKWLWVRPWHCLFPVVLTQIPHSWNGTFMSLATAIKRIPQSPWVKSVRVHPWDILYSSLCLRVWAWELAPESRSERRVLLRLWGPADRSSSCGLLSKVRGSVSLLEGGAVDT